MNAILVACSLCVATIFHQLTAGISHSIRQGAAKKLRKLSALPQKYEEKTIRDNPP